MDLGALEHSHTENVLVRADGCMESANGGRGKQRVCGHILPMYASHHTRAHLCESAYGADSFEVAFGLRKLPTEGTG